MEFNVIELSLDELLDYYLSCYNEEDDQEKEFKDTKCNVVLCKIFPRLDDGTQYISINTYNNMISNIKELGDFVVDMNNLFVSNRRFIKVMVDLKTEVVTYVNCVLSDNIMSINKDYRNKCKNCLIYTDDKSKIGKIDLNGNVFTQKE